MLPFTAGIPGEVRIVFAPTMWNLPKVKHLEKGVTYSAFLFNPATGKEHSLGKVAVDSTGTWQAPTPPVFQDWVIVLERKR